MSGTKSFITSGLWIRVKARGARFVEDLSEIPENAITIFSAHGVAKKIETDAKERGLRVLNATCPLVSKVHAQGRHYVRQGRTVVLIGHAGHPEVEGTLGQIPGPVLLVETEKDIDALDLPNDHPIAYVTQTTLSVDDTRGIIDALYRRFTDVVGPGTQDICYATQNRQSALLELTKLVDKIFVVGATNSSNSNRLREIGLEAGTPTHLIANGAEIRPEWLHDVEVVGITAGASAPEIMVARRDQCVAAVRPGRGLDSARAGRAYRIPRSRRASRRNRSKEHKQGQSSWAFLSCRSCWLVATSSASTWPAASATLSC